MAKVCVNLKVKEQTKSREWGNWERRRGAGGEWSESCQNQNGATLVKLLLVFQAWAGCFRCLVSLFKNESACRLLPNKNPLFQGTWWNKLERNTWSRVIGNHVNEVLQGPQLFSGACFYRVQEKEEFGCWRGHHMLLRLIDRLRLYKPLLTV